MELIDRRRRAVAILQTELARVYPAVSGERPKVQVGYRCVVGEATEPAALVAALERMRPVELRRGQTLVGPHRDDLTIELDGVDARAFGSRGQQRLLALAFGSPRSCRSAKRPAPRRCCCSTMRSRSWIPACATTSS